MPPSIELQIKTVAQLFDTLDPSPFREGDLAREAERYIVESARELPAKNPIRIVVHVGSDRIEGPGAMDIPSAIQAYFAKKSRSEAKAIRELFRFGRKAAAIGLAILSACLVVSLQLGLSATETALSNVAQESLLIFGWVAIWRPAEIFLYEWIPMARQRALYQRLSRADVDVVLASLPS